MTEFVNNLLIFNSASERVSNWLNPVLLLSDNLKPSDPHLIIPEANDHDEMTFTCYSKKNCILISYSFAFEYGNMQIIIFLHSKKICHKGFIYLIFSCAYIKTTEEIFISFLSCSQS